MPAISMHTPFIDVTRARYIDKAHTLYRCNVRYIDKGMHPEINRHNSIDLVVASGCSIAAKPGERVSLDR